MEYKQWAFSIQWFQGEPQISLLEKLSVPQEEAEKALNFAINSILEIEQKDIFPLG